MKKKETKIVFEDILLDDRGKEATFREVLIERLKFDSFFSPREIRFVESSQASN